METASFFFGFFSRKKRYSGQPEMAPKKNYEWLRGKKLWITNYECFEKLVILGNYR